MRPLRVLVIVGGVWMTFTGPAAAQQPATAPPAGDDSAQARAYFDKGMANFQLEEYDAAIDKWQAGFRIRPVPEFLYNIAQAYRLSHRPDKALSFYQKYLRMAPRASNHAEVTRQIAALNKLIDQQQSAATQPPTAPLAPKGGPEPTPAPSVATPAPSAATLTPTPTTAAATAPAQTSTAAVAPAERHADLTAQPPPKKPLTKKAWFWGVVAGGGAVVVAAVVVGVVLGTASSSTHTLPELRF